MFNDASPEGEDFLCTAELCTISFVCLIEETRSMDGIPGTVDPPSTLGQVCSDGCLSPLKLP